MDLKSGHLYWPTTVRTDAPTAQLAGDVRCDVMIIGSGVTGAMAAHHLAERGVRVAVADRRRVSSGSTPASTALVLYEIDRMLVDLMPLVGKEEGQRAYLRSWNAMGEMEELVSKLPAECDLARRPSVYCAVEEEDVRRFEREVENRRSIGIAATLLSRRELLREYGFDRPGAILAGAGFEVDPVKLTRALLASAVAQGALVFEDVEVDLSCVGSGSAPFHLRSAHGRVTADWIVIATGYETPEQFGEVGRLTKIKSTYALTTFPMAPGAWAHGALFWEAGDPYLYARTTRDGRLIAGGEDEEIVDASARDALLSAKTRALMRKIRALAPDARAAPEFAWAGAFAETADSLPYIGRHSSWPQVLFALGYGGNGITFSLIAAQMVRDLVLGRSAKDGDLFSFDRGRGGGKSAARNAG